MPKLIGVLFIFVTTGFTEIGYSNENLETYVTRVIDRQGGEIGPAKCIFCGRTEFKELVEYLPEHMREIAIYVNNHDDSTRLYVLGMAIQHLPFKDFIITQELFVQEWKLGKITNDQFKLLVQRPMRTTGRLFFLHKNSRVESLLVTISDESRKRGWIGTGFNEEIIDKIETGFYRRLYLRDRTTLEVFDGEEVTSYRQLDKLQEFFLKGVYPSISVGLLFLVFSIVAFLKNGIAVHSVLWFAFASIFFGLGWLFHEGIVIL